jgi:hypothetical protein
MKMAFFILILLQLFTSCNDRFKITGIVVDKSSRAPLDSVAVTSLDEVSSKGYDWISTFTSSEGKFMLEYSSKEIKEKARIPFIFQKHGYGSVTEFFPRDAKTDTIYLEKRF